jgi:hypothetical protein
MLDIIHINKWEKIVCMQFGANFQSKSSSICTNSENMREIDQNVPQFYDFWECSSGSRILRSQFFPGLPMTLYQQKKLCKGIINDFLIRNDNQFGFLIVQKLWSSFHYIKKKKISWLQVSGVSTGNVALHLYVKI